MPPSAIPIPGDNRINPTKAAILSLVSPLYRARRGLARLPVAKQVVYAHCILSHDGKLFFPKNAKVASTSTTQHIVRLYQGDFAEDARRVTSGVKQGQIHWRAYEHAIHDPDCVKFCFTRHPEEWVLSAFYDFFVDLKHPSTKRHLPAIKARGFELGGDIIRNFEVFLDYVRESHEDSIYFCDPHWRPQHINIGHGVIEYDIIGDIRTYETDLRRAFEMAGCDDPVPAGEKKRKFNASSRAEFTLCAPQKRKIRDLFAKDFELFSYA
ncbi:sulfotransferase family 2 domain-containing protein [Candidatus Halocynthiibacter alkanivorans]|uniref:sulfotransferase family 2 domain-containing protein n=1 Tax=Candidatus Halocynthiibacter alkanivorans TaxID=2267619 RepID=UPI000DF12BBC|nr:sulfotransferase family 2 domain-containing protein [Candidatus Halocynthiibacter alkanivorans]